MLTSPTTTLVEQLPPQAGQPTLLRVSHTSAPLASREVNASAPYLTYLYSGGGPGGCDEGNSDGFDLMDYEIYVKLP